MKVRTIRYLGILDGANLATGSIRDRSNVIKLESLAAARAALISAESSGRVYPGDATTLDGLQVLPIPGGLGEGAQLTLWAILPTYRNAPQVIASQWAILAADTDPYPDYILTLGSRGGVHTERA